MLKRPNAAVRRVIKPYASAVLDAHLGCTKQSYTSFYVRQSDVVRDQHMLSAFYWVSHKSQADLKMSKSEQRVYLVFRVGCFPFIKFFCRRYHNVHFDRDGAGSVADISNLNNLCNFVKAVNFGAPCLIYGFISRLLMKGSSEVCIYPDKKYGSFSMGGKLENKDGVNQDLGVSPGTVEAKSHGQAIRISFLYYV